jgi:archaemetzincin
VIEGVDLIRAGANGRWLPALESLDWIGALIARRLGVSTRTHESVLEIGFAEDTMRGQFYSSAILAAMQPHGAGRSVLAITGEDLFVPVLTFVFGEAQLSGPRAIVSTHRLREEYYGLPPNPEKLHARLAKEALHELGHTLGLRHCTNWQCSMASSHAVERLDLKDARYCPACSANIRN